MVMQTTDADNLFRSDADFAAEDRRLQKEKSELGQRAGHPIKLDSKGLTLALDTGSGEAGTGRSHCWVGESAFTIRRVDLGARSGETQDGRVLRGHRGPVTSITEVLLQYEAGEQRLCLASGSWDKCIGIWDPSSKSPILRWSAHTDFVKCLLYIDTFGLLVSGGGGSDRDIRIWDLKHVEQGNSPTCIAHLRGYHTRGIECLALLPHEQNIDLSVTQDTFCFVSGDSLGMIKVWTVRVGIDRSIDVKSVVDLKGHETSVYALCAIAADEIFSVSADKTAKRWQRGTGKNSPWEVNLSLMHDNYVKSVVLANSAHGLQSQYLITGSTDEHIYIWDLEKEGHLLNKIQGHFHEVTSLALYIAKDLDLESIEERQERQCTNKHIVWLASVSLDNTIRRWKLRELLEPELLSKTSPRPPAKKVDNKPSMTEEEEAELELLLMTD